MANAVNPKKLHKRLVWLWENRTHPVGAALDAPLIRWRYVPRAFSDQGPGWGVFDRLHERFLDDSEVVAVPLEQLQTATHLS